MSVLSLLLPELWVQIFGFVGVHNITAIMLVCKEWKNFYITILPRIRTISSDKWHYGYHLSRVPQLQAFSGRMIIHNFPVMDCLQTLDITLHGWNLTKYNSSGRQILFYDLFIDKMYRIIKACKNLRHLQVICEWDRKEFFFHYVRGDYVETNISEIFNEDSSLPTLLVYTKVIIHNITPLDYELIHQEYLSNVEVILYLKDISSTEYLTEETIISTVTFTGPQIGMTIYLPKDNYKVFDAMLGHTPDFQHSYHTTMTGQNKLIGLTFIKL